MKVVLSNGDVMQTRSRAVKSSVGYNLHQLLIGSEGTLCVVTELTLAIQPIPKAVLSARCIFPSTRTVSECVADLVKKKGISQLARAELVNAKAMAAVNMYSKTNYDEKPTLFLEFHGANDQVSWIYHYVSYLSVLVQTYKLLPPLLFLLLYLYICSYYCLNNCYHNYSSLLSSIYLS